MRELITALAADRDVLVGLVTGNIIGGAGVKLGPTGLAGHFKVGAYGSDSAVRSDLPALAVRRAEELTGIRYTGKEDRRHRRHAGRHHLRRRSGRQGDRAWPPDVTLATTSPRTDPDHLFDDLSDWQAVYAAIRA